MSATGGTGGYPRIPRALAGALFGCVLSLGLLLAPMRPYSTARKAPVAPATVSVESGSEANGSKRLRIPMASQTNPAIPASKATAESFTTISLTRTESVWRTTTASWYGDDYHGRVTASGEAYDQEALTAASPTLPLGTLIDVCRGLRCVRLRVNDRMPARSDGRTLDLSLAAAWKLGLVGKGIGAVRYRKIR